MESNKTNFNQGNSEPQIQIPETADRLVAFLDIMGFKDMVVRQNESNIKEKLTDLSTFINSEIQKLDNPIFSMFSDSIILFSSAEQEDALKKMIICVASIFEHSISLGLPIKGAVAKGKCTVSVGIKPFYFGQPIIDAYSLEENIVLYGVALHNSVEELAYSLAEKGSEYTFDYSVPLKGGKSNHFIINWFGVNLDINKDNLRKIRNTVSDSPRRYIDNTLDSMMCWTKLSEKSK